MWLGTLPELRVLSLRSNKLHGPIRTSGSEYMFLELRLLDLSSNAFTGNLPTSLFQHFRAIKKIDPSKKAPSDEIYGYYEKSIAFVTKGMEHEVLRILFLYTTIDFPNNKFEGHIPSIIGDLIALSILNLSHNGLQGPIPQSLGSLSSVESLDLSGNHLVGEIPAQFASLTFLEVSNLSYNHLEGCIPQGPQFHTFENNSYEIMINYMDFHFQKVVKATLNFSTIFGKALLWELGHTIMMARRKKQGRQRNYRRRNNRF
ncbi:hypothetical protein P3S67_032566 [Capsicum chacoense]